MLKRLITYIFILILSVSLSAGDWTWKIFDTMPTPVAGAELVTYNGKIYILGGYREAGGAPISTIQMYDPTQCIEKRWSEVGNMQIPRSNFVAKLYEPESCIYISGGTTDHDRENVPTMEKWDLKTSTGTIIGDDIQLNRTGATGEIWHDLLFIIGGYNNSLSESTLGYIAVYDLVRKRSFHQLPSVLTQEPYEQASVTIGDSIYIFGGIRFGVSDRIYNLDLSFLDDPWPPNIGNIMPRVHPGLEFPRSSMEAVKIAPDTVWLIGGYSEDSTALHTTSKFVIRRSGQNRGYEHEHEPPLLEARKEHVAGVVNDTVFVFGGVDKHGKVLNTVETFIDTVRVDSCGEDTTEVGVKTAEPQSFKLQQNYPNPFNSSTRIEFELAMYNYIRLEIYSSQGRLVTSLINEKLAAGLHQVVWDGRSSNGDHVPSGLYFYKLITEHEIQTRKMLLVK